MNQKRKFQLRRGVLFITKLGLFLLLLIISGFLAGPLAAQTTSFVSGQVFEDLNLNNTFDYGEKPLANWQVDLYQNDKLIQTQLTDSTGNYYFTGLASGNYLLKLAVPDSWAPVGGKNVLFNLEADKSFIANFSNYQIIREKQEFGPMILISNVSVKSLSPTAVEVSWFTTHQATSQVVFAQSPRPDNQLAINLNFGYPFSSAFDFKTVTYHNMTLFGLKPATNYYYRVSSLADPKQWRGATRILSSEFSFTTSPLPKEETVIEKEVGQEKKIAKEESKKIIRKGEKEILAAETKQSKEPEITATETPPIEEVEAEKEQPTEGPKENAQATTNCLGYVWFLLLLNLITTIILWSKGKKTNKAIAKRLWWLMLILFLVPVILGYPHCWLTIWLIFTFILALIFLTGFKKKSPPPSLPNQPVSNFKPSTKSEDNQGSPVIQLPPQLPSKDSLPPSPEPPPSQDQISFY